MAWLPKSWSEEGGAPCGAPPSCDVEAAADGAAAAILLQALGQIAAPVCLCDAEDRIRFANPAFRSAFLGDLPDEGGDFAEAVCAAIAVGKGPKLESMPLDAFRLRIRGRRRAGILNPFCVDMNDGSWWRIEEQRTAAGWLLLVATEISSLKNEEQRLREAHAAALEASQTDYLTGVANRRWGMEEAQHALETCAVKQSPLTIALLDIDHFKKINDMHGHDTGDLVLVDFARSLIKRLGLHDRVSRIGGEEFMVVMRDTPLSAAALRLERLMRTLPPLRQPAGRAPLKYTFSGGVATAACHEPLKLVLARADAALYQAKAGGRQRIELSVEMATDAA